MRQSAVATARATKPSDTGGRGFGLHVHVALRYNISQRSMKDHHDLKVADYRGLAEFRYQIRKFVRFSEGAARRVGLEPQHHQLMLAVKGMPESRAARIADLAERLQLEHHSVVELANRLEKRGLIQKVRGEQDRREVRVKLTTRGDSLLGKLTRHTRAELRSAAPALVRALQRITRHTASHDLPGSTSRRQQSAGNGPS